MNSKYSEQAEWIVFKLVRKGRWGHYVMREDMIPAKPHLRPSARHALQELVAAGILRRKHGLGIFTYSLNPHRKEEILDICKRFSLER
jgi:uncharacterized membrane protein